jgi:hypothetical protein
MTDSSRTLMAMSEKPDQPPASSDERSVELGESRKGIDVRPTSDPSAVVLPAMGGLAPAEAAPDESTGSADQSSAPQASDSSGGSDSG